MNVSRRTILRLAATAPAASLLTRITPARAATTLKISHQFPGGTIDQGDFRDRLCRKFAAEVTKATNGELEFQIYPGSSMMKTNAQFSALRKGALDLSLFPISYAGGEIKEVNIGLMPALVPTYEEAAKWKTAKVGQEFARILSDKGVVMVSWVWQAGGMASRGEPIVDPDDAKGKKIRGGSREMDLMLSKAGAAVRLAAVERGLRRHADRRHRRRADVVDQPHLVPPGRSLQGPDGRSRQVLLVHARAADHVEDRLRRPAEEPAGRDHGGRRRGRRTSAPSRRRPTTRRSSPSTRRPAPRSPT